MIYLVEDLTIVISCFQEVLVEVQDLDGNLVTGYATGDSSSISSFEKKKKYLKYKFYFKL
jgi:hypothetical protein